MGQQQILLIVLVMIVVGTAILVGTQIYDASSRDNAITTITNDLLNLSTIALNYYRTPSEYSGGGQSFKSDSKGWTIPQNLDTLGNRVYSIVSITKNSIEILGQSIDEQTGLDQSEGVQVYLKLDKNGVHDFRIEN